jgi:hypothetical protein
LAVSRRIYQLCGVIPGEKSLPESESPLQNLGLRDFTRVIVFMAGLFGKLAWATGRPSRSIKLRNEELHTLFTNAHKVFETWPLNFHQFLRVQSKGKKRLSPNNGELDTALKREFGSFYERLYEDLREPPFDFVREAFAEFLTLRLKSQSEPGTMPDVSSLGSNRYIPVTQARRLLKITHRAMFDLIKTGEIDFVIRNEGTVLRYLLLLSDVQNVKDQFERAISPRTPLARQLGVDCKAIHQLAKAGLLQAKSRRATDGYHTIKFAIDAAEKLLKTFRKLSNEPDRFG